MIAKIGVERKQGGFLVVSESLWDNGYRDFSGVLEGMLNEQYDSFEEIEDAVNVLLDQKVEVDIVEVKD